MPAPSIPHISIGTPEDLEALTRVVENSINSLVDRINASAISGNLDMQQHRVTNLSRPTSRRDAVNLDYLSEALTRLYRRIYNETSRNIEEGVTNITVTPGSTTVTIAYA